jgi:CHAT domain-containing protein
MLRRLLCAAVFLMAACTLAHAQQPSQELQGLRDTAAFFYRAGAYREALEAAERAAALVVREFGPEHEESALSAYSLGLISDALGDLTAAERHYTACLHLREKIYGPESAAVAAVLENLGQVLIKAGRQAAAQPLLEHALHIEQELVGRDHAFSASGHAGLGALYLARGDWTAALTSYRTAIRLLASQDTSPTIVKSLVEQDIKRHRDTFIGLCRAVWNAAGPAERQKEANVEETFQAAQTAWQTSAAAALAKMTARLAAADSEEGQRIRRAQDLAERVLALNDTDQKLIAEFSAVERADASYSALADEFRKASIARSRELAPTLKRQTALVEELQRLAQRCPPAQSKSGCDGSERTREALGKELGELGRRAASGSEALMDIYRRMEAAQKALPGYAAFAARRAELRGNIDRAEEEVRRVRALIAQSYPQYAALVDPMPLSMVATQRLLASDEALIVILSGGAKSFVWALSRERAAWAEIDAGSAELAGDVAALRRGLDPLAQQDAEGSAGSRAAVVAGFDLERAHALYARVLAPVAATFSDKRHLIIVPTGPLTSLPLQVLLTEPPRPARSAQEAFRNQAWLIKSYALSVLPSVASLSALRTLKRRDPAAQPFFGIGDPVLEGGNRPGEQRGATSELPAHFYRHALADVRAVRALTPLPETADELRQIARALGAASDSVHLREAATETRVKAAALSEFRVLHFATHGLVAGDLSDLAEPALVLTPPAVPSAVDDGLLTASEVATLKLNADWVVLSACNTAAGSGPGAEALSGLARAFFYAGARALLVSHWPVDSRAAVEITTSTFRALATAPHIGRAEALRRSLLALIAAGRAPGYWAPFVVVGEGGAPNPS